MSLLKNNCANGLKLGGFLSLLVLTACSQQPQNFNDLTAQNARDEHLQALEGWIYPSTEAEEARRAFVERCVSNLGGHYQEPAQVHSLEEEVYTGRSTQELKDSGYSPLPLATEPATASFDQAGLDAYLGKEGQTFTVNFMDYSTGPINSAGCMAQSYQYIYGSAELGLKTALLAPRFGAAIEEAVRTDSKYQALQEAWARCMNQAGFPQVSSADQASYQASLLGADQAEKMLAADITCREENDYDQTISQVKNSYYEAVYQRLRQFSKDFETASTTSQEKIAADAQDPKSSSEVTLPTTSPSPSAS